LGAQVIAASDDFFAPKERLIDPTAPVFVAGKYDDHGKWMDGWESRRKRTPGHDSCVIGICPGTIHGVDIDTSFFTGNYPPHASLDACNSTAPPDARTEWRELIAKTALAGNAYHYLPVAMIAPGPTLRLNIYPDGGVARLRCMASCTLTGAILPRMNGRPRCHATRRSGAGLQRHALWPYVQPHCTRARRKHG
jgi:allantoicase